MQQVSCPSCGGPVAFKSHASVMAVCEYCKATLLKEADAVRNLGRMSDVLEDYSPIQIGTAGRHGEQGFTVIGRIQLRYDDGMWNEWYVLFDDGRNGWLSDASGQYTLTFEESFEGLLPDFGELAPGNNVALLGQTYIGADIRSAQCTGGQGELPFPVHQGWQARVADFRRGRRFVTLDYSESERPKLYAGQSVQLDQLQPQLLRDDDTVKASAGKFQRKVARLACPSCGSNIAHVPGLTRQLVCPSCRARIDTSSEVATVLEAGERMDKHPTTLELGAKANISGSAFEIIGVLQRQDEEGSAWTEYLLYSPRAGFLWLVETEEGWSRAKVLDEWPSVGAAGEVKLGSQTFRKKYDYTATVTFAAGAFNWRVKAGDMAQVSEFESGKTGLAAERTTHELTWSHSVPVATDQIRAWFGKEVKEANLAPKTSPLTIAKYFFYGLLGFNFVPLAMMFDRTWTLVLFAIIAIYLPALFLHWTGGESR